VALGHLEPIVEWMLLRHSAAGLKAKLAAGSKHPAAAALLVFVVPGILLFRSSC